MKKLVVIFLCVLLLASLPLYSIRKDTKLLLEEIQKLSARIQSMEQLLVGEVGDLNKRLKAIEEKLNSVMRSQADIDQNKDAVGLSLQFLKEEINEMKNRLAGIDDRLVSLTPASGTAGGAEGDSQESPAGQIQSPETTYYTAYSDYLKSNYDLAIQGFRQFLQLFPTNALADNSLYWIGECYYSKKEYREAVSTFTELISQYAEGDKIPAATLKKGYALIEMGDEAEGVNVLKQLISRFPLSEEASLAQQKIRAVTE